MSRKQKIIVSITGIFLVLMILVGLTYAYFLTKITGNTNSKSISVTTANLVLEYGENTNVVQGISNAEPGYSVEKIFTATNKGNSTVTYGAALESIVNGLTRQEDLVYTLTCTSYLKEGFSLASNGTITGTVDGTCSGVTTEKQFPNTSTMSIMTTNTIDTTHTHAYKLTVKYKEMGVDQSEDMNKAFSAKVNIIDTNALTMNNPYKNDTDTLKKIIIDNAMLNLNETEFLETPKTIPAEETSSFIHLKGIDPTTFTSTLTNATNYYISYADDYTVNETSGKFTLVNPTVATTKYITSMASNLVGKYAVWSTNIPTTSNTQNQSSIYKISNNVSDITSTIKYATISSSSLNTKSTEKELSATIDDYGTSYYYRGGVKDNYINFAGMCWKIVRIEGDGSTKLILEDRSAECNSSSYTGNWSDGNTIAFGNDSNNKADFLNYSGGLADSLKSFQTTLGTKVGTGKTLSDYLKVDDWCYDCVASTDGGGYQYYGAHKRIKIDKNPTLKCTGTKLNKFKDNTDMYVGTLTADEMSFAGATGSTNYSYYLMNNYVKNKGLSWWGLSPDKNDNMVGDDLAFRLVRYGSLGGDGISSNYVSSHSSYSRPAISLKSNTQISSGTGTKENPYTVKLS